MKTKEEVKDYLENHFFKNRRHAYPVRNALIDIDEFKGVEFNIKWAFNTKHNGKSVEEVITSDDALNFIFGEWKSYTYNYLSFSWELDIGGK